MKVVALAMEEENLATLQRIQYIQPLHVKTDKDFFLIPETFTSSLEEKDVPCNGLFFCKQTTAIIGVFDGKLQRVLPGHMDPSCLHPCNHCEETKTNFNLDPNKVIDFLNFD